MATGQVGRERHIPVSMVRPWTIPAAQGARLAIKLNAAQVDDRPASFDHGTLSESFQVSEATTRKSPGYFRFCISIHAARFLDSEIRDDFLFHDQMNENSDRAGNGNHARPETRLQRQQICPLQD